MALRRLLIGIIGKIRGQRALDRYRHKIQFIEIPTLEYHRMLATNYRLD